MIIKIIILIILFYAIYVIINVDDNKTEGFGNVDSNANFVTYETNPQQEILTDPEFQRDFTVDGKSYNNANNFDYAQTVLNQNKDLVYYYNDVIDQTKINETATDVENGIDLIDYGNVKTGLQKCRESCSGVCTIEGYDGVATCYPPIYKKQPWDLGTLYKNPAFILGITDNN